MPSGGRGDSPLTDMLYHGLHPFPPDMEAMLREVLRLQPNFPDGKRPYVQQIEWISRFDNWKIGKLLDEGRTALRQVLSELNSVDLRT